MSLYNLADSYRQVLDNADLDQDVMQDTLDSIKEPLKDKADSIAWLIEFLQNNSKVLRDKAKSFTEEAKHQENKAKWLQEYLTNSLDLADIKKLQTENHILSVRNYKASTIVDNENKVPAEFRHVKEVVSVDKNAVYKALKNGEEVPGAHLKPNRKTSIK
jgi:uncharacterized protein YdiU (UPF0061 family)